MSLLLFFNSKVSALTAMKLTVLELRMSLNVWKDANQMKLAPGSLILNIKVFACFLQTVQVWTRPSALTVSVDKRNAIHLSLFAGSLVNISILPFRNLGLFKVKISQLMGNIKGFCSSVKHSARRLIGYTYNRTSRLL